MCGDGVEVHDTFQKLDDLKHESSLALRNWVQIPLAERRAELREERSSFMTEHDAKSGPQVSGAGNKGSRGLDRPDLPVSVPTLIGPGGPR